MRTVALEFVPPTVEDGAAKAFEEARKVRELSRRWGIDGRIRHLLIPGMIEEDPDRPIPMAPRMDPLDAWQAVCAELAPMRALCTQVTAFLNEEQLAARVEKLRAAGVDGIIAVGVPRTMADGEGGGVAPTDALSFLESLVPHRGVILIPTRQDEAGRFQFKCRRGATFALTQLLYSDAIVGFLKRFAAENPERPEILLSFGFVPGVEERVRLIRWLIQDPGNPVVDREQEFVARLAGMRFPEKKQALLDHYRRIVDGVADLGFPFSIHLEAPYGFSSPAFETFAEMLAYWSPDRS